MVKKATRPRNLGKRKVKTQDIPDQQMTHQDEIANPFDLQNANPESDTNTSPVQDQKKQNNSDKSRAILEKIRAKKLQAKLSKNPMSDQNSTPETTEDQQEEQKSMNHGGNDEGYIDQQYQEQISMLKFQQDNSDDEFQ